MTMWSRARACVLGATVVAASLLAACGGGGGGGDSGPEFAVAVKVNGVADASNPMTPGESTTISVPSGSALVFDSEGETTWAPKATDSSFEVTNFSPTSKAIDVTSNTGGMLVIVFADKADASKSATLTVNVAPKEFQRVARVDGELETWSTDKTEAGKVDHYTGAFHTVLKDDGYAVEIGEHVPYYYGRANYDSQDRYLGWTYQDGSGPCFYDKPVVIQAYPLHVGLSWNGQAKSVCYGVRTTNLTYTRTVEAYERVVVPQGTHDALRIRSVESYSVTDDGVPPSSSTKTSTCWWAVDLGRYVKCITDYTLSDSDPYHLVDQMTGLTH